MPTTISVYTPEQAGQVGLVLKIYDASGILVNTGGDVLTETSEPGVFQASVDEALSSSWYRLDVELSGTVVDSAFKFFSNVVGISAEGVSEEVFDLTTSSISLNADGGYEFTGGFTDRTTGQAGASDIGSNVLYTQEMVDADQWLRFGFDTTQQAAIDVPYWTDPTPAPAGGIGLFGGSYLPDGATGLFDFSFNDAGYSNAVTGQSLNYTAATGSYDFTSCQAGDLALVRFDFNVLPQVANTTLEIALIWQTRDASDVATFTFALTGDPNFYGVGTVGRTYLSRPTISAYFASNEDVNARALPAIKADNPVQIQPLTTLATIIR